MSLEERSSRRGIFSGGFDDLYRNLPRNEVRELIIGDQKKRLLDRGGFKYFPILTVVDAIPTLRTCYHFGRMLDDMADGDNPLPFEFTDFDSLADYLKERVFDNDRVTIGGGAVEFLMHESFRGLLAAGGKEDEVRIITFNFIEGMRLENKRKVNRSVLSYSELQRQFHLSFDPSEDVAFIAVGSKVRSADVPELAEAQARSYSIKDLKADLTNGVCNIPAETFEKAEVRFDDLVSNLGILDSNPVLMQWKKNELSAASILARKLRKRKLDFKAKLMVNFLTARI